MEQGGKPLKDFYEEHFAKFDKMTTHLLKRIKLTEEAIRKYGRSGEILEIGCGTGENLHYYASKFGFSRAYCVEISSSAEEKIREKGLIPLILDVNVDKIPLSDESIDVIIFEEVIEHLYNSDLVMNEIKRLLKEGGILVLSTPNLASWINRLSLLFGYQPFSHDVSFLRGFGRFKYKDQSNGHIKSFTLRAMLEYLKFFGLEVLEVKGIEADGAPPLISRIDSIVSKIPSLASHMFVVARKL